MRPRICFHINVRNTCMNINHANIAYMDTLAHSTEQPWHIERCTNIYTKTTARNECKDTMKMMVMLLGLS